MNPYCSHKGITIRNVMPSLDAGIIETMREHGMLWREIAALFGITTMGAVSKYRNNIDSKQNKTKFVSLTEFDDCFVDETEGPFDAVVKKQLRRDIGRVIKNKLSERRSEVLRLRFLKYETLIEVAKRQGVTRERIRQVEIKALQILRRPHIAKVLRHYHTGE